MLYSLHERALAAAMREQSPSDEQRAARELMTRNDAFGDDFAAYLAHTVAPASAPSALGAS